MAYKPFIDTDAKPIYLVVSSYSGIGWEGMAYAETASLQAIADFIADGQLDNCVQAFEISATVTDVTKQVADIVWAMSPDDIADSASDFLARCGHDLEDAKDEWNAQPTDFEEHGLRVF